MSKIKLLLDVVEDMRSLADSLQALADAMTQGDPPEAEPGQKAAPPPPKEPAVTLEQVRAVLAEKSHAGKTEAVRELLQKYGAPKLSAVDPKEKAVVMMDELLQKVKENLILEHDADDKLLERFITAAISYAESYQHIAAGYYQEHPMPPTTEQAVIMLSSHFYESRDGSTGGFFADNVQAGQQVWNTVNLLLRLDREWKV